MNVETNFTPVAEANASPAAKKLTDAELEAILAGKPIFYTEGDEVSSDEPTLN